MTAKATSVSMGCSLVLAIALLSRGVAEANLVENGGFETGDFSGWEVTSDTAHGGCQRVGSDVSVCGAVDLDPGPHGGGFAAYLGQPSAFDPGLLSQSIGTVPGQSYTLDFWLANLSFDGSSTPNDFQVTWNGTVVLSLQDKPAFGYSEFTMPGLLATGSITTLQFIEHQNPAGFVLDDVSVTSSVTQVPEPGLSALLAIGFIGLVGLRMRAAASL